MTANPFHIDHQLTGKNGRLLSAIAAAVLVLAIIHVVRDGGGAATVSPDALASQIGAAWCDDSGYELENRLDSSKAEIYDCNMPDGSYRCVTSEDGLSHDVTVQARLLWKNVLGGDRPDCLIR